MADAAQIAFEAKIDPAYRAALIWRLPVVRHVRWFCNCFRVAAWYGMWARFGFYETNDHDRRCLAAIRRGKL